MPKTHLPETDERWFSEWVEWGMRQINASLQNHADFDQYLITHPRKEDDDPDPRK